MKTQTTPQKLETFYVCGGLIRSSQEEEEDDWCETGGNRCNMTLQCHEGILCSIICILMVNKRAKGD